MPYLTSPLANVYATAKKYEPKIKHSAFASRNFLKSSSSGNFSFQEFLVHPLGGPIMLQSIHPLGFNNASRPSMDRIGMTSRHPPQGTKKEICVFQKILFLFLLGFWVYKHMIIGYHWTNIIEYIISIYTSEN